MILKEMFRNKTKILDIIALLFLRLDDEGTIQSVSYNNQMRSQFLNLPLDKVQPLYNALKLFDDLCYDDEYLINLKLKPGNMFVAYKYLMNLLL